MHLPGRHPVTFLGLLTLNKFKGAYPLDSLDLLGFRSILLNCRLTDPGGENRTAVFGHPLEVVDYQRGIFAPPGCFVRKCPVFKIKYGDTEEHGLPGAYRRTQRARRLNAGLPPSSTTDEHR